MKYKATIHIDKDDDDGIKAVVSAVIYGDTREFVGSLISAVGDSLQDLEGETQ